MLTTTAAAALLGIHPQPLRRYVRADLIPAYRVGHHFRFERTSLLAFLERMRA